MSTAVLVHDAYKRFGYASFPFGTRAARLDAKAVGKFNGNACSKPAANIQPVTIAIDHVSFEVQPGEIFGVVGACGSGKSTLIRLLATLILPDSGNIHIFGYDVVRQPVQVQRLINRVSVEASFFKRRSPLENLIYDAELYNMGKAEACRQASELLFRLGLEQGPFHSPMEELPRAMQQKVAIARALLSRPRLLLLDDPTADLDPQSKREVLDVLREMRDCHNTTILITTRDILEALSLCDRIAVIESGKIVALDIPAGLQWLVRHDTPTNMFESPSPDPTHRPLVGEEGQCVS